MNEQGERKRKSFSGANKAAVNKKMTDFVEEFQTEIAETGEEKKTLRDSMTHWLQVLKFPFVERGTYDRLGCSAKNQVYPLIGSKAVDDITAADLKAVINHWMAKGYALYFGQESP